LTDRQSIETPAGRIAFVDRGEGPAALFVHGVFMNADLWDGAIDGLTDVRRCIAPDILCHGETVERADADVSFAGQARMLIELLDALELRQVDVVANDSGGGIAQILAARHPERVRTLTLTNCDVHDGWPPPAFLPTVQAILAGGARAVLEPLCADPAVARGALAVGFEHPERLSDDTLRGFLAPLLASDARVRHLERFFAAMDCRQTVEIEPLLRRLAAPTLVLWGTGDVFFDVEWGRWLCRTIPGARPLVELPGAKLFFPYERPARLAAELRRHWGSEPPRHPVGATPGACA
jgi:pimeloyl-ACP methyl ester carboxylesterase